jgi:RNA methyltransferase, TrmH family
LASRFGSGRDSTVIESPSNPTVQMLRELHRAGGRRERGAFLLEGTRLVAEAVKVAWPLYAVLYDVERVAEDEALSAIVAQIPGALPASARAIKHASDTVTPQGIVAAASTPETDDAVDPDEPLVLVLDGVSDPGNAGTLLRSAAGAGIRTVLASHGSADLFAPKVVRGGMGAHFHLRLGDGLSWAAISARLGKGRVLVVAERDAGMPYYEFDWRHPAALIIGSESRGPSPDAMQLATATVSIPLEPEVESLNAAVAGSVLIFDAKRQRDMAGRRTREHKIQGGSGA